MQKIRDFHEFRVAKEMGNNTRIFFRVLWRQHHFRLRMWNRFQNEQQVQLSVSSNSLLNNYDEKFITKNGHYMDRLLKLISHTRRTYSFIFMNVFFTQPCFQSEIFKKNWSWGTNFDHDSNYTLCLHTLIALPRRIRELFLHQCLITKL